VWQRTCEHRNESALKMVYDLKGNGWRGNASVSIRFACRGRFPVLFGKCTELYESYAEQISLFVEFSNAEYRVHLTPAFSFRGSSIVVVCNVAVLLHTTPVLLNIILVLPPSFHLLVYVTDFIHPVSKCNFIQVLCCIYIMSSVGYYFSYKLHRNIGPFTTQKFSTQLQIIVKLAANFNSGV
jgi:hypothetical protein